MLTKNQTTYLKYSVVSLLACLGIAGSNIAIAKPNANLHNDNLHKTNLHKTNLNQVNIKTVNAQQIQASDLKIFKLKPRVNVWGFTGDRTLAETQILFPLKGDNNQVLYAIAEGNYTKNDSSWMTGFGFGYRQIVDGKILGGYAIADYFNTSENEFVIANPGIEVLGFHDVWDFSLNGYIPLDKQKKTGKEGWAGDDFENYSYGRATGHNFYDHKLQTIEEVGTGLDVEIGRTLPCFANNAKLYLGGYHFDTQDSGSINGVSTRFTYDINKYTTLELENSYDNLHKNKFLVGVRFSLGGYSQDEKQQFGLATRLLEPRNHGMYQALVKDAFLDKGEQLQHDNVWYFKPGEVNNGSNPQGSGTAEDPLINFTPANYNLVYTNKNIGTIDAHPLMYFASGEYSFADFSVTRDSTTIDHRFALENGWGMYGRSNDYKAKANGNERASFVGGLDMNYAEGLGHNATTLNSIMIYNTKKDQDEATLYIVNADNVIFNNVFINNTASSGSSGEILAINADKSTLNFVNGTNTVSASSANLSAFGILANDSTIVNFMGGTNQIIASSPHSVGINVAYNSEVNFIDGINAIDVFANASSAIKGIVVSQSKVNFIGGINNINAVYDNGLACGIKIYNNSEVNFIGGINNINADSDNAEAYGINIFQDSTLNFIGGINSIKASSKYLSLGIYNHARSTVNFIDGENNISVFSFADNAYSYGIDIRDNSKVIFTGGQNTLDAFSNGGFTIGLYLVESSTVDFNNRETLKINIDGTVTQTGIYASNNSSINYWNASAYQAFNSENITDIAKYVTFTKKGEGNQGQKIEWNSVILPWSYA